MKVLFIFLLYLPELISAIIPIIVFYYYPRIFNTIAIQLFIDNGGNFTLVWGMVIGLLGLSLTYHIKTLFPKDDNKILLNWPDYLKIKILSWSVFVICLLSAFNTLILWIFKAEILEMYIGLLYCIFTFTSFVALFTLIVASVGIREIFEKHS